MNLTVSVVSHGHGVDVRALLERMAEKSGQGLQRVIVTLNVPEPELRAQMARQHWPFDLVWIDNDCPAGFGTNHNRAFRRDTELGPSAFFAILNPDICWEQDPFQPMLLEAADAPQVGLIYPVQRGVNGQLQDHERLVPTLARLCARYRPGAARLEVSRGAEPEWVNGAFMLFRRQAYSEIKGFDEAYFMYGEDVDVCLRLQLAGWQMRRAEVAEIQHAARRASRRELRHLLWHIASLWRLWRSPVWRAWRRHQKSTSGRGRLPRKS